MTYKRKKVLIVSYCFPPWPAIGSQRPYGLAKYLPEYGWEPIVVTPKLAGRTRERVRVIETDYKEILTSIKSKIGFNERKSLREKLNITTVKGNDYSTLKAKLVKLFREVVAFPDEHIGWYTVAVRSAGDIIKRERIDVLLSTFSPGTCHLIARRLKKEYKIPWVADFRDLWCQNHYYDKYKVIQYVEKRLERKTVSKADAIVAVTPPLAESLRESYGKEVFCITNGFDEDDYLQPAPQLTNRFSITHTGTLYNGKRDPSLLLDAVRQLIAENKIDRNEIEIRLLGPEETWVYEDIRKYELQGCVTVEGLLPREDAIKKQKESQLLLLLLWDNKHEEGVYTGKLFEYLGAKRPIVAVGCTTGIIANLLRETNAGVFVNDLESLKNFLATCYDEFRRSGKVAYKGNIGIENYTYRKIAFQYSQILNSIALR